MGTFSTGEGMRYPHEPAANDRSSSGVMFSPALKTLASDLLLKKIGLDRQRQSQVLDMWQSIATPEAIPLVEQILSDLFEILNECCEHTGRYPLLRPRDDEELLGTPSSMPVAAPATKMTVSSSSGHIILAVPAAVALDDLVEYSPTILMDKSYRSTNNSQATGLTTNFGGGATQQRPFKATMQMVLAEDGHIWAPAHTTVAGQTAVEQEPLMGAALTPLDTG